MPKEKSIPLEKLSKNDLIKKCENQKQLIQNLVDKNKRLQDQCNILRLVVSNANINHKLMVCMQETMSYIEDVEDLKNEIKKLKGEL